MNSKLYLEESHSRLIKTLNREIFIISLFLSQVNDLPTQLEKMDELCHLPGFRHDAKLIEETGKFEKTFLW